MSEEKKEVTAKQRFSEASKSSYEDESRKIAQKNAEKQKARDEAKKAREDEIKRLLAEKEDIKELLEKNTRLQGAIVKYAEGKGGPLLEELNHQDVIAEIEKTEREEQRRIAREAAQKKKADEKAKLIAERQKLAESLQSNEDALKAIEEFSKDNKRVSSKIAEIKMNHEIKKAEKATQKAEIAQNGRQSIAHSKVILGGMKGRVTQREKSDIRKIKNGELEISGLGGKVTLSKEDAEKLTQQQAEARRKSIDRSKKKATRGIKLNSTIAKAARFVGDKDKVAELAKANLSYVDRYKQKDPAMLRITLNMLKAGYISKQAIKDAVTAVKKVPGKIVSTSKEVADTIATGAEFVGGTIVEAAEITGKAAVEATKTVGRETTKLSRGAAGRLGGLKGRIGAHVHNLFGKNPFTNPDLTQATQEADAETRQVPDVTFSTSERVAKGAQEKIDASRATSEPEQETTKTKPQRGDSEPELG